MKDIVPVVEHCVYLFVYSKLEIFHRANLIYIVYHSASWKNKMSAEEVVKLLLEAIPSDSSCSESKSSQKDYEGE